MSLYLSLKLYEPKSPVGSVDEDIFGGSAGEVLYEESDGLEPSDGGGEKPEKLLRSVTVSIEGGFVRIESESPLRMHEFTATLNEQLSNEFLIQVEMLDLRKWEPMHYSPAYAGDVNCYWVLEYCGLKGESIMHSGNDTYPKNWPVLMDLIDAFGNIVKLRQESVRIAAGGVASMMGADVAGTISMVNILSSMQMPQDVIAAGIFRSAMRDNKLDLEYVARYFDSTVLDLLGEFGDESGMEPDEKRIALLEHVKASDSLYFKRIVLAEALSDLIAVKASLDRGEGFNDPVMDRTTMGLYYAELIANLDELEKDQKSGVTYARLVDLYKTIFVSYSLDSIRGVIYQTQGDAAGVMLKRGEYDWHPIQDSISEDAASVSKEVDEASPVSKEFALFLASLWRREADEKIVRDGNKEGAHDVSDITALKVVMGKATGKRARKDNKVAISILTRMISEDEQLLSAIRAEEFEKELIENGEVDDVSQVPVSFLGVEDDEGKMMAAVFTSIDELGELDPADIEAIPVKMIFQFVKNMGRLDGIILDPFTDRFVITKEKIAEVLDDLARDRDDLI